MRRLTVAVCVMLVVAGCGGLGGEQLECTVEPISIPESDAIDVYDISAGSEVEFRTSLTTNVETISIVLDGESYATDQDISAGQYTASIDRTAFDENSTVSLRFDINSTSTYTAVFNAKNCYNSD